MKILVCVKQVPGSSNVEVDPVTGVLKRNNSGNKINPYDLYAIETALFISEKYGAEVETITMGPPQAKEVINETVCMGVARGTVLSDRRFAGADVLATAHTLSHGIKASGKYDIIICGKQTTDGDTAQVGAELSEYLGIPNVSNVLSVDGIKDNKLFLTVGLDDKIVKLSINIPCLLSVEGDINTPRLPSYKIKKSIGDGAVRFLSLDDFDDKVAERYGLNGSATQVERIFPPEKNETKETVSGNAEEQAEKIFELLLAKKMVEGDK